MSEDNGNDRKINVSEDRMRGVIAEFELRFRDWLEEKLEHKADLVMLTEARTRIQALEGKVDSLNEWRAGTTTLAGWQRWFVGAVLMVVAAALIAGAATVVAAHFTG